MTTSTLSRHSLSSHCEKFSAVHRPVGRQDWRGCVRWAAIVFALAGPLSAAILEFDEYLERANAAKSRGDWESAASQFAQAINHPDLPGDGATRSAVNLEYGRAIGVLCHYDEAEKYLLRAKALAGTSGSTLIAALYELGAISVAQKKFAGAVGYFAELVPMIDRAPRTAPPSLVVADAYEKFAVALAATGQPEEAERRRREAGRIREAGPKAVPPGTITPYGAQCRKS